MNDLDLKILTQTFDELPIGVGIFEVEDVNDPKSIRYVFMNKVILYEMRKNADEVFGKRIIEVAPEAYEHEGGLFVIETYRRIAAEGGSINLGLVEYSNHMVAGTYECSVHHIKDNYVYVMLRNVTELEQTKNELEQKNKELSQFAYLASHDLKEPLRTISSFTEILQEDYLEKLDKEGEKLLSFISKATKRMRGLIDVLLDYSKLGQGKELVEINCSNMVAEIQEDLSVVINERDASLEVGELPTVKGFKTELRMLFQNLISNAIKFNQPGVPPKVSITAEEKDGWTFSVKDNGIGISEANQEKIFSLFERLHTEKEYEGTGIGLGHCKKIIELHKGKLWVESVEGEGSTFYFNIPKS